MIIGKEEGSRKIRPLEEAGSNLPCLKRYQSSGTSKIA